MLGLTAAFVFALELVSQPVEAGFSRPLVGLKADPTSAVKPVLVTAEPAATQEAAQPPSAQKAEPWSSSREPQTTRTVDATRDMRLALDNFAGDVIVRAWDKNAVRVDARHPRGETIQVERTGDEIEVSTSRDRGGLSGSIDYETSVPSWMPLRLTGTYLFVSIEGVQADIQAGTVRGDVAVRGGAGSVSLKSIEGDGSLEGATGRIELSSVEGILSLNRITASVVEASTIDGEIVYEGAIAAQGQYRFTTHDGDVLLPIPENTGASVTVRTYDGRFDSSFPVQPSGDFTRGRRVTFTLGKGGAEIDIEAFDGQIRLMKAGEALPAGKNKKKDKDAYWPSGLRWRVSVQAGRRQAPDRVPERAPAPLEQLRAERA